MRLRQPTMVAAEATADGRRWGYYVALDAIRDDRKGIAEALGFALAHSDPFPLLRALAADLGGEAGAAAPSPPTLSGPTEESLPVLRAKADRPFGTAPGPNVRAENLAARAELARRDAEPGPTEHVDMALRFRYWAGVFETHGPDPESNVVARPERYAVAGLRVRIVYQHSASDAEAAQDCAESWRSRMMGAGAREVECVGEVEK